MSDGSRSELSYVSTYGSCGVQCKVYTWSVQKYTQLSISCMYQGYVVSIHIWHAQNPCMFSCLTCLFSQWGGWRCILLTVLTNCFIKPWRMILNCNDIIACLQLCQFGALAGCSVDVYDTPVRDTRCCLGSKQELGPLEQITSFTTVHRHGAQRFYSFPLSFCDLLSPDQMTG